MVNWGRLVRRAVKLLVGAVGTVVVVLILLLVGLTLLLGSGCGCTIQQGPLMQFEFEIIERSDRPDGLRIVHDGGDSAPSAELYVTAEIAFRAIDDGSRPAMELTWAELGFQNETVSTGSSIAVEPAKPDRSIYETPFRVVWKGVTEDGDPVTATLGLWERTDLYEPSTPNAHTLVPRTEYPTERRQTDEQELNRSTGSATDACNRGVENVSTGTMRMACQANDPTAVNTTAP